MPSDAVAQSASDENVDASREEIYAPYQLCYYAVDAHLLTPHLTVPHRCYLLEVSWDRKRLRLVAMDESTVQ